VKVFGDTGDRSREEVAMRQLQERKTATPPAKKREKRSNEMTAKIPKAIVSHSGETITTTKEGDLTMETTAGFAGFDAKNVSDNCLRMMRYSLDTTLDGLTKIQEFNDRMVKNMLITSKQIQADAEEIVSEWSENSKKGWDEYRKVVETGFRQAEELIQPAK
jgi:hypothetical protein